MLPNIPFNRFLLETVIFLLLKYFVAIFAQKIVAMGFKMLPNGDKSHNLVTLAYNERKIRVWLQDVPRYKWKM